MTLKEAYEKRRQEVLALQHEVNSLQKKLDEVSASLYTPDEKVELLKKVSSLTHKLKRAEKDRDHYHELWNTERKRNMYYDFGKMDLEDDNKTLREEIKELKRENERLQKLADQMQTEIEELEKQAENLKQGNIPDAGAKIIALSDEVARLTALLNNDGTNSGTSTSKTPLNKNKLIPNSREKSGKAKGGQPGHKQHTLGNVPEEEVTCWENHTLKACPYCGGELEQIDCDDKDELDYEVKVIKKRHKYPRYKCKNCGKESRAFVENRLKEKCQYGSTVQAMILALLDIGFVSVNRVKKLISGFFAGQLNPCEAFIIGMQKKASGKLDMFAADVKSALTTELVLYWDDTVVFINKSRGCMRFYGTEKLALFTAHAGKGRDGLDEDGLLALLSSMTFVMHDHNTVNYNEDFIFINIECIQHLERDLQKLAEISGHEWVVLLKQLITSTIHDRKQWQKRGETSFTDEYVKSFFKRLDELLAQGSVEYEADRSRYYEEDERRLLNRLKKYRDNYFMWVTDFRLPTTNNLSERSLRFTKVHDKVSGQFESVAYAKYFAKIRTYLETCARNGINEFAALLRLTQDNPYTLSEVLSYSGS